MTYTLISALFIELILALNIFCCSWPGLEENKMSFLNFYFHQLSEIPNLKAYFDKFFHRVKKDCESICVGSKNLLTKIGSGSENLLWTILQLFLRD